MCFIHISLITSFVSTACPTKSNEHNRIITNTELLSSVPARSKGNIAFLSAFKLIRARSYLLVCAVDRLWANRCTEGWWTAEHPNSAAQNQWRPWQRQYEQYSTIKPALSTEYCKNCAHFRKLKYPGQLISYLLIRDYFGLCWGHPVLAQILTVKRNQIQNGTWGPWL